MQPGTPDEQWREDCAPRRVLELFATKWTSMILHTLHARHGGTARTGVLHRSQPHALHFAHAVGGRGSMRAKLGSCRGAARRLQLL